VDYVRHWSPDISTIFRQPLLNSPAFLQQLSRSLTFLCFPDNITKLHDNLPVGKFSENLPTHTKTNSKQSTTSCYAKKKTTESMAADELTAPVSMSNMRAPRLHQSTALLWPLWITISGALTTQHSQFSTLKKTKKINLMPKLLISFDVSFRLYAICINYQLCLWHRWHQNRSGSANDKHTTTFLLTIQ